MGELILALETSGMLGGIALYREAILEEILFQAQASYSKSLFYYLPNLLDKNKISLSEINYLAVDIGPGSFTGLRIGLSLAKALSLPYNLLLLPINSLELLAYNFPLSPYPILSIINGYSKEVFIALYRFEDFSLKTLIFPQLRSLEEVPELIQEPTLFVSETLLLWEAYFKEVLKEKFIKPPFKPFLRAGRLAELSYLKLQRGEISPLKAEELLPLYLKPSSAERKNVSLSV